MVGGFEGKTAVGTDNKIPNNDQLQTMGKARTKPLEMAMNTVAFGFSLSSSEFDLKKIIIM